MKVSDFKRVIKSLAENDQSIQDQDILDWLDDGIKRINTELKANFPLVSGKGDDYEPEFDPRYHEALNMFAQMRYREADADYNSATYWKNNFTDQIMSMQRDMKVPPAYRADNEVQQIVVPDPPTLIYDLSMDFGSYFDVVEVYQNNNLINPKSYQVMLNTGQIVFDGSVTLNVGDKITIVFQENSDLNNPPYSWWSEAGW